ncbi:hypothetical protein O181_024804 [Austropuccinia psidii MF-1]|uniref:Uncharacterized protein n=1 Tax=Austropuccinia psidii MF-1 TaxID=1389203 RepID=A0A9Q3CJB8_9BASI|nr:hypothetical protein [Austropuccinia psidii MF-1]
MVWKTTAHPQKYPQRGGNTVIHSYPSLKKDWHNKKREESKEKAPVASTSKQKAIQSPKEGKENKKNNWRKPCSPSYRIPRIQKYAMENFFNMARALMEFQ